MKKDNVTLKTYFETGDYPTEAQFIDLIDSFLNIEEEDAVTGITDNGDNTYTFQLLSGGTVTVNGGSIPDDIPIANIIGLQASLDILEQDINNLENSNTVAFNYGPFNPNGAGKPIVIDQSVTDFIADNPDKLLFWTNTDSGLELGNSDDPGPDAAEYIYNAATGIWFPLPNIPQTIPEPSKRMIKNESNWNNSTKEFSYNSGSSTISGDTFVFEDDEDFKVVIVGFSSNDTKVELNHFVNRGAGKMTFELVPSSTSLTLNKSTTKKLEATGPAAVTVISTSTGESNTAVGHYFVYGDLDDLNESLGGTITPDQIAHGSPTNGIQGSPEFIWDGVNLIIRGSGADRYQRWVETLGQFNGAYFHYEGATNKFHIGVHATADNVSANDLKVLTMLRSNGFVGIFNDNPQYEVDINGTFNVDGALIAPTFANFTNRVAVVNPSFGSSRLGDSALQSPSIDTKALNFMADTGQTVNFAIFENNNVMTIRSLGGDKLGVLDFNGAHQADYTNDNAEATFAATLRYADGKGYVNDVGVQRYLPGSSVVAQAFFDVMINSGGAPRMKHVKTYYDGTTYDVIRTIEIDGKMVHEKTVEFKQPTIGVDATQPNELVTKAQLDAVSGGGGVPTTNGTWIPTIGPLTGLTFGATSGSYYRIGDLVHISGNISTINGTADSGIVSTVVLVNGLPYMIADPEEVVAIHLISGTVSKVATTGLMVFGILNSGFTSLSFSFRDVAGGPQSIGNTVFASTNVRFSATYRTTDPM